MSLCDEEKRSILIKMDKPPLRGNDMKIGKDVQVLDTCDMSWDDLDGAGERRRHCRQCTHDVHNLSAMTPDQAAAFAAKHRGRRVCVHYAYDRRTGRVVLAEPTSEPAEDPLRRLRRWVAAASVAALPLASAACSEQQQQPMAEAQGPHYAGHSHAGHSHADHSQAGAARPAPTTRPDGHRVASAESSHDEEDPQIYCRDDIYDPFWDVFGLIDTDREEACPNDDFPDEAGVITGGVMF